MPVTELTPRQNCRLRRVLGRIAARGRFRGHLTSAEFQKFQRLLRADPALPDGNGESFRLGLLLDAASAVGVQLPKGKVSDSWIETLIQLLLENWEVMLEIILAFIALF